MVSLETAGAHEFHVTAEAELDPKSELGVDTVRREARASTTVELSEKYHGTLPEEPKLKKPFPPTSRPV